MNESILNIIRALCPSDIYEIGFADLSGLIHPDYASYPYAISIVRKLDDSIIDRITGGPTMDYFNLYHSVNIELNEKAVLISEMINSYGIKAIPITTTVSESEIDDDAVRTMRYKVSHKMSATRAGLGWIGKTDLLVTRRFGPRVRLATVLVSQPVSPTGEPIEESQCGSCELCVKACPACAASGLSWTKDIDRDIFYSADKCLNYCRYISKKNINKEISICGICLSVCPKGKIK